MEENEKIFFINSLPVGLFQEADYPDKSGRYRYRPLGGPGHCEMQEKLKSGAVASCSFEKSGNKVLFSVVDCHEEGLLDLADFKIVPSRTNA